MQTLFQRALVPRATGGLALILAGAITFALTAPNSWMALASLLAHLGGLLLLYVATRIWMEHFGGRARFAGTALRGPRQGCGVALLRVALITVMVAAAAFWLWCTITDLHEMWLLVAGGRVAIAQVIGRDIVPATAPIGYIHYSYRASPTMAPEDRFRFRDLCIPGTASGSHSR